MSRKLLIAVACVSFGTFVLAEPPLPPATRPAETSAPIPSADRPLVQIALLLDTSNSMDGLINQARTQLWTIVNEVARAKRDGQTPRLEVALIEYGNDNLAAGEGFIRMVLPLTGNLDDLSEKLFALTTNGGSEFCGQAIRQASSTLNWSADPNVYKAIFIAGNEPFGQGQVDYRSAVPAAIARGIVVNTIHCGEHRHGLDGGWAEGAKLGEGYFTNIDQNRVLPIPRCPQDDRIEHLSIEINVTYVPYGKRGRAARERQTAQDRNAADNAAVGSAVRRAESKANAIYDNRDWDLVDAVADGEVDLAKIDIKDLPESMREMSVDERRAFIASQAEHRAKLREEINRLLAERGRHLASLQKQPDGVETLESAIIASVREQLKQRQFEVEP